MPITSLDHVNIRTANLDAIVEFYGKVLGLTPGPRPPFSFNGSWLYCDDKPVLHLVEVKEHQQTEAPRIEHFAMGGVGLADFLQLLRDNEVAYWIRILPEWGGRQVNLLDPDGNHLHCDFAAHEEADLSDFDPAASSAA